LFNNYDYKYYSKLSSQSGFHKDVIEKVHRLINTYNGTYSSINHLF